MLWNATAYCIGPGEFGCCGIRLHVPHLPLYYNSNQELLQKEKW